MNTEERRKNVVKAISSSDSPISAATLAQKFNVSQQIIVGDVALLRAEGTDIVADHGGTVIDVTVEHSVYGQLSGHLNISSRIEAARTKTSLTGSGPHSKKRAFLFNTAKMA